MADKSFFEVVQTRRTIRRFKPDPIPDSSIEKILDAARYAQSGANGQPWEFIVVKDAKLRSQMARILAEERTEFGTPIEMSRIPEMRHLGSTRGSYGGHIGLKVAPASIVVLGDPRTFQATVLCASFLSGEWDHFHMGIGNCTQILTLAACAVGLQAQWVTKELLGIPLIYRIYVVVPIGYPDYDSPPPYRRPLNEIVHYDKYDMSKYRDSEKVQAWIKELRQRTTPHYHVRREEA